MPTQIVSAGKFRKVRYDTPRRRKVELQVEASSPINVYLIDAEDLDRFRSGGEVEGSHFSNTKRLETEVRLPLEFGAEWYLVIENPDEDKPVAVHYDVFDG